jgi:hypothetical protein
VRDRLEEARVAFWRVRERMWSAWSLRPAPSQVAQHKHERAKSKHDSRRTSELRIPGGVLFALAWL